MKKLSLSLAALLVMFACSSASAAVFRVGPVRVATRPVAARRAYVAPAYRPAAPAAYVAPAYRPAARATVRARRATGRAIIHDHRVDTLEAIQDALWP